jgi:hypothetical protein
MPLTRDAIIVFMKAHPHPICSACLTRALRLPFDRVMDAWADVRLRDDFPIRKGRCSVCRTKAEVIHPHLAP